MLNSNELGALSDRDLLAESRAYEVKLKGDPTQLNLTPADASEVESVNNDFEKTLDNWDAAQMAEDAASQAKKAARKTVLNKLRNHRNQAYADSSITEEKLAGYGIPPRDKIKTASPAPTSAPIGYVDYGKLKHTIYFRDSATPDSEAKPKGMRGCEIWRFTGAGAPASESDFDYVATDTASPYVAFYTMADAGEKVSYLLRWISNSGETGEWSETVEATVNG